LKRENKIGHKTDQIMQKMGTVAEMVMVRMVVDNWRDIKWIKKLCHYVFFYLL